MFFCFLRFIFKYPSNSMQFFFIIIIFLLSFFISSFYAVSFDSRFLTNEGINIWKNCSYTCTHRQRFRSIAITTKYLIWNGTENTKKKTEEEKKKGEKK